MTIKVKHVYFVRRKRLKGGKVVARCLKKVSQVDLSVEEIDGVKMSVCTLDHPKVKGRLITDFLKLLGGVTNFNGDNIEFKSYFKGRNFKLHAYSLDAIHVNTNSRRRILKNT